MSNLKVLPMGRSVIVVKKQIILQFVVGRHKTASPHQVSRLNLSMILLNITKARMSLHHRSFSNVTVMQRHSKQTKCSRCIMVKL